MSELEETLLWQLKAAKLPQPLREYRFALPRRWRFDLAFLPHKVAVEVEGGVWTHGRHTRGAGYEADCEKYSEAALLGWKVLRVTGRMVQNGKALALLERALREPARALHDPR